ncbi:conjugative transposon TraN protein [Pontibacter ummariensis]|uniref:Bacteroides conjugative transposon TraN protein n=1 Tax=Pontibacter ummariensis TaxID=1610492 RepID=A0A239J3Q3_9BACT|nr:conjugative transposon protein TraN [Pontibacter ummariensis]PRY09054.1 conjugative transposon TraN protein [Pontibacter ummariensis]SNS99284.1 Bacteroides conjugative transposon TraN protein [Pontibacter ummariensis]
MKRLLTFLYFTLLSFISSAQTQEPQVIFVHEDISTHIISPEPIMYVDISTDDVAGDIPVTNILRIKPKSGAPALGVVTVVGERFMVQYRLRYASSSQGADTEIRIDPTQVDEYLNPAVPMSRADMKRLSLQALQQAPGIKHRYTRKHKMELTLNNVFMVGDYFFVDVSMKNRANIPYSIDQVRFKIEDKKVVKATNFQQTEIKPVFALHGTGSFKRKYRNVFVFRKFTFPEEKVLRMEVSEQQVSGRCLTLEVDYKDVLDADIL